MADTLQTFSNPLKTNTGPANTRRIRAARADSKTAFRQNDMDTLSIACIILLHR